MMHEWLNVGRQEAENIKISKDSTCPCCGEDGEGQVNMYHCPHEDIQESLESDIHTMEANLNEVYTAFIDIILRVTHSNC